MKPQVGGGGGAFSAALKAGPARSGVPFSSSSPASSSTAAVSPPRTGVGVAASANASSFGAAGGSGGYGGGGRAGASASAPAAATLGGRDPHTAKLSDYLVQYSQNVTMLNRLVQNLGGIRDCKELRSQYRCQLKVLEDLSRKINEELGKSEREVDSGEGVTRQEAARLRVAHAKLKKDYKRVSTIADSLKEDASKRIADLDRRRLEAAQEEAAIAARLYGGKNAPQGGIRGAQAQKQTLLLQEEEQQQQDFGINEAIIQETENELLAINRDLHQVNEIFKDLATIVAQQQEQVDHIEISTEAAHERAQQGLAQVQKAHNYQAGCSLM